MKTITIKPLSNTLILSILTFLHIHSLFAQQTSLSFDDKSYLPEVHSVEFYQTNDPLTDPVLRLNDAATLTLAFDIISDMAYTFDYTIIHCNRDWTPSALRPQEYIEGFADDRITDYTFSLNTLTPYVHYRLSFPGSQLRPRLSGNYLLVVYRGNTQPENLILSRRFIVLDAIIPIQASVAHNTRQAGLSRTHQMLEITVSIPQRYAGVGREAFSIDIFQNNRKDNARYGLNPTHVLPGRMSFEYLSETTFEAGNQWRNFDIKNYRYQSERIQRIIQQPDSYVVRLWPDVRRNRQVYKSEPDLNGRRLIKARADQNTAIEGDYAWVEFFLPWEPQLTHDEIFVVGQLTDWKLDEINRMQYNYQRKGYELSLFLKQGYYNYLYVLRDKKTGQSSLAEAEGNFWDTRNKYTIVLYFRQPGTVYDQVVGYTLIDAH